MKHVLNSFCACVLLSAAAFTSNVFAQTGPGGVGNVTGSGGQPENKVWFRADAGTSTTTDNTPISTWTSSSDNTVQATQNTSDNQPVLRTGTNGINGRPVVRFDGSNDFFNTNYTWPANQDEITMILVGRGTNFQSAIRMQSGNYIVYPWSSAQSFILSSDGGTSGGIASGLVTDGTTVNIGMARYRRNTTNGMQTFRNGTLQTQRNSANNPLPSENLILGSYLGIAEFTNADIAEAIIYRAALNEAQRIIVENYLSSKYNVNIGTNDRYAYDDTHGNDVAGIGQAADGSQHTSASSSRLNISSPSSLANNRFALFGHNNGALTLSNANAPAGRRRLNRVWRYDEPGGDVGTVTITFDVSGISIPSGETFRIFVDGDGDGNFSNATEYPGTLSGNTFTVTANIPDDSYITLGRTFSGPSGAPVSVSYTPSTLTLVYGTAGNSVAPDVDDGGSPITEYDLVSAPAGISINTSTGVISVAGTTNVGTYTLLVTATNGVGSTTFTNVYTVTVQPFDVSSVVYNTTTTSVGAAVSFLPTPTVPASGVSFSATGLSPLTINSSTGEITGSAFTSETVYQATVTINSISSNTTGGPVTRNLTIAALGATGPGGVGGAQTSPVWFRADAGTSTTTDNTPINTWTSSSDNTVQATQNTSANQPVLRTGTNGINGRPVVRFDGSNDFFNTNYTWPANQGGITMILVGRGTNFQSAIRMQSGNYIVYPWSSAQSFILSSDGGTFGGIASGLVTDGTTVNIGMARYRRNTTNGMQTFRNGTLQTQRNSANNPLPSENLILGSYLGIAEFTNADIAEAIIYRAALNEAQRIIVENYLSSKYNVNIGTNDRYAYDDTHGNDVAGIGQAADGSQHTNASSSRLNISSPLSLANNRFALFGHDNGSLTLTNNNAPPSRRRLNRVWRYDEPGGDVGTVTITFDVSGISIPSGETFRIFVDGDGDGNFSNATEYPGTLSGNTFTVTANIPDDSYITLGRTFSGPSGAPVSVSYTPSTLTLVYGTAGNSVAPDVDDGGSPITEYDLVSAPAGISINTSTGVISVAGTTNVGTYTLLVTATNGVGSTTFTNVYTVTVQPFDVSSVVYNTTTTSVGAAVSFLPTPTVPASGVSFSATGLSPLTINSSTGEITGSAFTSETVYQATVTINSISSNTTGGPVTRNLTIAALGATGPGGVGGAQTSPVWFRADAGTSTTTDNTPINTWTSSSDNTVQATQNTSDNRPVLRTGTNGINDRPVVRFDGSNDFFNTNYTWPANQGGITMILVGRGTNFQSAIRMQSSGYIVYPWSSAQSFILSSDGGTSGGIASGLVTDGTTVNIGMARYRRNTTNGMQTFRNGTLQTQRNSANNPLPSENLILGSYLGIAEFTNADIAEAIIYRAALNEAQRIIVENYLSAKYGVTIPAASDFYAGTSPYLEQVHGIGTTDGTVKHTRAQSSGGLLLEERNTSLNATNEFLLAGHNGTNPLPVSIADLPSGVQQRWSRIWYLDKTGTIDARIAFDFSDANVPIIPGIAANYRLLYRAGTSGTFSEVTIVGTPIIQNTDQVAFNVDDANLQDGYYTLGTTNPTDSPLPVELISFTLMPKDKGVLIEWQTGSEVNNAGFILQRSLFREGNYTEIASYRTHDALRGLGTSPTGKAYTYFDNDRLQAGRTYFYKLLDVDFSGNLTEHPVKEITLPNEYSLSQNYPNPFNPTTTIEFSLRQDGRTTLEVFNILGQVVATLINENLKAGAYQVRFNASVLPSGVYFYRLRSGEFVGIKKMMLLK
jgi:hypothetical protein